MQSDSQSKGDRAMWPKPVLAMLSVILLIGVSSAKADGGGGLLHPKDANLFVLQEAHGNPLALMGQLIGDDPGNALPWSGAISNTGWSFDMTAPYRDGLLSQTYSGALDPGSDVVSWTGITLFTNGIGSVSIASDGTYTNASVDGDWLDAFKIVVIAAVTVVGDVAVVAVQGVTTVGSVGTLGAPAIAASGTAIIGITAAGATGIVNVGKNNSGEVHNDTRHSKIDGPFILPFPIDAPGLILPPPYSAMAFIDDSQLVGDYANEFVFINGTGTLTAIPEPSTMTILGLGTLGLIGFAWRKKRVRP